jgi:hypothetical protein
MKATIKAKGTEITVLSKGDENDFISLTDIARYRNRDEPKDVVKNWMRSRSTIEFLGLWEQLNNPNFKGVEFDSFINEAGSNAFTLSPQKWISTTNAVGMLSRSGRYGGTFAHKDIAFEFASWVSAEFKLYICHQEQPDPSSGIQTTAGIHLCQRSRYAQCRPVWEDSQGMERAKCGDNGQYAGRSKYPAAHRTIQSGKHECGTD